ncbi:hypothetical protein GCM10017778_52910 [Streptomyces vinaceus]|nr:hypothetical protein GCM10017778_52910 [Streptomyces vinaceus]
MEDTTVRADQPPAKAAMIYRHSNLERQREAAAGIDARMRALSGMGADCASGTRLARDGERAQTA